MLKELHLSEYLSCSIKGFTMLFSNWQIERVQNATLWQSYQLMKKQLELKNKHSNNERQLFHGTDANSVEYINTRGFDRGFAGAHGTVAHDPVISCEVTRSHSG